MKNKFPPLYLILFFILLLSACEDNSIQNDLVQEENLSIKVVKIIKETIPTEYHYKFKNLKGQINSLEVKNDIYNFKNIKQPIVIVNMMSTWCPPCRGQLPHLSKLQKKFKKDIFIISSLVHDDIDNKKLEKLLIAQKILFYVSLTQDENLKFMNMIDTKLGLPKEFPLPLTILFFKGKYFTHYEGMIPEEMIESDINQLLEKIKK